MVENTHLESIQGKATKTSKTDVCSVVLIRKGKRYKAQIVVQGKCIYLGNIEDAAARKATEENYFAPILEKYNDLLHED